MQKQQQIYDKSIVIFIELSKHYALCKGSTDDINGSVSVAEKKFSVNFNITKDE